MKFLSPILIACLFCCSIAYAQGQRPYRSVHFDFIAKDSIKLAFNEDYELIEDSCSTFTRYTHINMNIGRKFVGKIKDVSRLNPNIITAEGTYNKAGEKEGLFTTHYINGQLRAKGNFLKNKPDGKWELYYDDGKPQTLFEVNGDDIQITDHWDNKGHKDINNGKGTYRVDVGYIYWKGKLVNGRPDGTWSLMRTEDVTNSEMSSEKFKLGVFQKGKLPVGEYTNASHMQLIPPNLFPFIHAEDLKISAFPCNAEKPKRYVSAQYSGGMQAYGDELIRAIAAYFYYIDVQHFTNKFTIDGEVDEQGYLTKFTCFDSFNQGISDGLIMCLKRTVPLTPATIDGKPAKQKIHFVFNFFGGTYRFTYGFGEIIKPVEKKG
ncbi:MAG: hypothetical protein H7289_02040 [Mucilaginibacter sp.]|nr:hypothetical protein [Mucilaginibacter sp.]